MNLEIFILKESFSDKLWNFPRIPSLSFWVSIESFSNFETALFRLERGCRRKKRCDVCLASSVCSAH